jgi:hypothetical protein
MSKALLRICQLFIIRLISIIIAFPIIILHGYLSKEKADLSYDFSAFGYYILSLGTVAIFWSLLFYLIYKLIRINAGSILTTLLIFLILFIFEYFFFKLTDPHNHISLQSFLNEFEGMLIFFVFFVIVYYFFVKIGMNNFLRKSAS